MHCLKLFLYEWLCVKYSRAVGSKYEALGVLGSKSWRKQTHILAISSTNSNCDKLLIDIGYFYINFFCFLKKMGVSFLQLFYLGTPEASNQDPMEHEYFMRNHSYKNSFKQCNISYNFIKFGLILEFKVSTESRYNFLCFCTLSM